MPCLILPSLEYASSILNPYYKIHNLTIDKYKENLLTSQTLNYYDHYSSMTAMLHDPNWCTYKLCHIAILPTKSQTITVLQILVQAVTQQHWKYHLITLQIIINPDYIINYLTSIPMPPYVQPFSKNNQAVDLEFSNQSNQLNHIVTFPDCSWNLIQLHKYH